MNGLNESDFMLYTSATTLPKGNILVLAPPPDDEIYSCGGAIRQHLKQGDEVFVVGFQMEATRPRMLMQTPNGTLLSCAALVGNRRITCAVFNSTQRSDRSI